MIDPATLTNRAPWPQDPRSQALLQRWIVDLREQLAACDRLIDDLRANARVTSGRLLDAMAKRAAVAAELERASREGDA